MGLKGQKWILGLVHVLLLKLIPKILDQYKTSLGASGVDKCGIMCSYSCVPFKSGWCLLNKPSFKKTQKDLQKSSLEEPVLQRHWFIKQHPEVSDGKRGVGTQRVAWLGPSSSVSLSSFNLTANNCFLNILPRQTHSLVDLSAFLLQIHKRSNKAI